MKNTAKNNESPDLLPVEKKAKPVSSSWVTAVQISELIPFAAINETFLRNRAREINPRTNAPWIPKPRDNQFELQPTLIGLLEWFHAKAAEKDGVPTYFDSMQDMQDRLRIPKDFIRWALEHGCEEARLGGSRINPRPILAKVFDTLRLVAAGKIEGIEGFEQLDKDAALARKLNLESENLEDDKLLRRGEMLLSRDGSHALRELIADELLWEKRDQPLRAELLQLPKKINRQHRTILSGDEPLPDKIRKCADAVQNAVSQVLEKVRGKIPKRLPVPAEK